MAADGDDEDVPVRFAPSRVLGMARVEEVAVWPDRLEVRTAAGWRAFPFAGIAAPQEPGWVAALKRRTGGRPFRPHVAELVYVREPYAESFFRFYTEPRLTVYMPAGGPALAPDSVFWRVQEVLRRGGYAADDPDPDADRYRAALARRPRWVRAAGRALLAVAVANLVLHACGLLALGGRDAVSGRAEHGRYVVAAARRSAPHRELEVSRAAWTYSYVTTTVATWSWLLIAAGGTLAYLVPGQLMSRRERLARAPRWWAYGKPK